MSGLHIQLKNLRIKYLLLIPVFTMVFASCKKTSSDSTPPVVILTSPANHQVFTGGQVVTIAATITDNVAVNTVHLFVTNNATGASVYHFEDHVNQPSYSLNKTFTVIAGTQYTIEVYGLDGNENEGDVKIDVSAN